MKHDCEENISWDCNRKEFYCTKCGKIFRPTYRIKLRLMNNKYQKRLGILK